MKYQTAKFAMEVVNDALLSQQREGVTNLRETLENNPIVILVSDSVTGKPSKVVIWKSDGVLHSAVLPTTLVTAKLDVLPCWGSVDSENDYLVVDGANAIQFLYEITGMDRQHYIETMGERAVQQFTHAMHGLENDAFSDALQHLRKRANQSKLDAVKAQVRFAKAMEVAKRLGFAEILQVGMDAFADDDELDETLSTLFEIFS